MIGPRSRCMWRAVAIKWCWQIMWCLQVLGRIANGTAGHPRCMSGWAWSARAFVMENFTFKPNPVLRSKEVAAKRDFVVVSIFAKLCT